MAVVGSFVTRLGIGGVPFLLPLLYQIGLGLSPIQSGLLIMPQALAAICAKPVVRIVLDRFGYRGVLMSNTVLLGVMLMLFAAIGAGTPMWTIVGQALCYGMLTSTQYTSMNTLVYADVPASQTSNASSIASTFQQLSISFGIAAAGLTTAVFVAAPARPEAGAMIAGLHNAFIALGAFTLVSTAIFLRLKKDDGALVSHSRETHLA